jgi:membrane protein DedA with SNARE-associated domain
LQGTPWRVFLLANAAGAAIWVATMTTVGVLLGANLDHAVGLVERVGYWGLGAALLLVALAVLGHRFRLRRRARAAGRAGTD